MKKKPKRILLLTATFAEIKPLCIHFSIKDGDKNIYRIRTEKLYLDILISGIGLTFTSYWLTKQLQQVHYDIAIHVGIAGSFNSDIKIGQVVLVKEEQFGDLGIENGDEFIPISETAFFNENSFPFISGKLINKTTVNQFKLIKVSGLSVNKVQGNAQSISKIKKHFKADIETMESAAFFYVCLLEKIPFVEIRSISNYVEERGKTNWNIPLAIKNLNLIILDFFDNNL